MNYDYDVVVIGLGPVGSFAALLLEKRGLRVLAIDKDKEIYSLPRAVSISDQGLRMTQEIGIEDVYINNSSEVGGAGFVDKDLNFIGGAIDLKGFATPNGWAPMRFFHQPFTDQEIRKRLGATSITTLLQHEILNIEERENDVLFSVKNLENSSEIEYTAKY